MLEKSKGIKCAICNRDDTLLGEGKVCISCYFTHDRKIPKYIPFEQHDLWIIKNNERNSK